MRTLLIWCLAMLSLTGCKKFDKQPVETTESFTFAFLTDIHVQPELRASEGFSKAIDKVNELSPDFVITGGDLIMDALGVAYERADSLYTLYANLSEAFNMPVYNTMGNHEIFGLYVDSQVDTTHPEYNKKMFEGRIGKRYYSFNHKGWHFIVLDAIGTKPERSYYGFIDEEQIEWLEADRNSISKDTPVVIIVHIPFITSMTQLTQGSLVANNEGTVIVNAREVLLPFYEYNLKLVLQGHLHFLEDIYIGDKTHFITGGAVSASWWKGPRGAMEEGFVLVRVENDDIEWEYIDYGWEVLNEAK